MTDWIGLELRHLTALRAVATEGTFKDAAQLLGYTPSAISQQVANLEKIVGARVIERQMGRSAFGLTEEGKALLVHLEAIEARLEAAKADLHAVTSGACRPIRVGAFESVEKRLLPAVMRRFRDEYPQVAIEMRETLLDLDLLTLVERGLLDAAFGVLPLPEGPWDARVVLEDPWVLVVAESRRLEYPRCLTIAEIADLPLVCWISPSAVASAIEPFRAANLNPNIVYRSDYNGVVQELAAARFGVALLPRLAVDLDDERTATIELTDVIPPRQLAFVRHRDRVSSEALERFASLVDEVAAEIARDAIRLQIATAGC